MPLISIITPTYNGVQTLGATIDSVRAQSFADWEMLVIDDASHDGTTALALRHAHEDSRIRVIHRAENGGVAKTRNQGLAATTGRYIAFLDGNDLWLPEKLQAQLDFMQAEKATISCTAYRRFRNPNKPGRLVTCPPRVTFETLQRQACVGTLTVMIDRDQSGAFSFNEQLGGGEDLALWLDLTKAGHDIVFLNQDLARHRLGQDTQSFKTLRELAWSWHIYRHIAGLPPKEAFSTVAKIFLRKLVS